MANWNMSVVAKANVPCVGLLYSGYWVDEDDLDKFVAEIPPHLQRPDGINFRRAPNEHDDNGALPPGYTLATTVVQATHLS